MLKKRLIVSTAFAAGVTVMVAPVLAQVANEEEVFRQRFRIEQEFGVGDNLGLQNPSEGRTTLATTRLSYGLESKNRNHELSFALGGALRFGNIASGNNIQTGFTDPFMGLRYFRDTGNATLSVNADYRQSDISLAAPLWTFLDQDGLVRPPRDFSNIRGSGERRAYSVNVELETGKLAPFGLRILAGTRGTNYINQTDADLVDFDTKDLGLAALFRLDALTTASIDLAFTNYTQKNAADTSRDTISLQAGFDRELSAISQLSFRFGYTDVDTTETNPLTGLRFKTKRSGPSGNFLYSRDLPNGTAAASFDLTQNQTGQRGTLRFTRSLELPTGGLTASIGLTSFDSTDPRVIGSIDWFREFAASRISRSLDRDVFVDSNDEDRFTNLLIASYQYEITSVSRLSADLSLTHSEAAPSSEASERGSVVVVYNHQLTDDWSFNTGVEYNVLDEDVSGRAESSSVFFGIGRNFDF